PSSIRAFAAERLPEYMVPATVVLLDELPLTPNGKIDQAALPAPEAGRERGRAPSTPVEAVICDLFAQVLGLERVSVDDSFFALGGDSILSMLLVSGVRRAGWALSPRQVFEEQTPARLALIAEAVADGSVVSGEPGVGDVPLTPVMCELIERVGLGALGQAVQSSVVATPIGVDAGVLASAVRALVVRHEVLRARL
ncbi:phosphopantetheine-binding protein, partial [Streptomyces sp. JW3]|uniref:phosphopantetheine-binding protein n=1 Tax=Streptomyces sp. JW3 TaxID=3456955 RepID=UPI003FA42DE1